MSKRVLTVLAVLGLALLAGCGGGSKKGQSAAKASGPEVEVKDLSFKPRSVSVKVGGEVHWAFADKGITHNVTAEDGSFKSANMASGTFAHKFDAPRSVRYSCTIHPTQMRGTIEVRA